MNLLEALKMLGIELNEEQSKKASELNENWIPKTRFDEVNEKCKEQQKMVAERDEQIKNLGESAKSVEEYQTQIAQLTEANQKANEEWSNKYKGLAQQNAFNSSVSKYHFKEKFLSQVNKMIDVEKLTEQDGNWSGYDEQLAKISEDYPEFVDSNYQSAGSSHDGSSEINRNSVQDDLISQAMGMQRFEKK